MLAAIAPEYKTVGSRQGTNYKGTAVEKKKTLPPNITRKESRISPPIFIFLLFVNFINDFCIRSDLANIRKIG